MMPGATLPVAVAVAVACDATTEGTKQAQDYGEPTRQVVDVGRTHGVA